MVKGKDYLERMPDTLESALERFRAEVARRARPLRVLYLERGGVDIEEIRRHFTSHAPHIHLTFFHSVRDVVGGGSEGFDEVGYDVLALDFTPSVGALEVLKELGQVHQVDLPIVLLTERGDEELAVQALRLGASDYLVKNPGYLYRLPGSLENAYHRAQLQREQSALRASEERYRRLTENARDIIYRYRLQPERGFEYVSPAMTSITGYTPEECYRDPELILQIVHPEDQALMREELRDSSPRQAPLVLRVQRKDGALIWLETRHVPIVDSMGELLALEGIARDTTERKQAEEMAMNIARGVSAATGEMFFRSLVRHIGEALNADFAFIGEVSGEDQLVKTIAFWAKGEIAENIELNLTHNPCGVVMKGKKCVYPSNVRKSFPESRFLEEKEIEAYVGAPLFDSTGCPLGLMSVLHCQPLEETGLHESMLQIFALRAAAELERRLMEETIQSSEKRFRALIENSTDGFVLLDGDGTMRYASPNFTRISGYAIEEFISRKLFELVHPDELERVMRLFSELLQHPGNNISAQVRLLHKDGSWRWLGVAATNSLAEPAIRGIVANFRDITERKEAEERIQGQIQRLNALRAVDMTITASLDLRVTLSILLEHVTVNLGVHAADILLLDPHANILRYSAGRGFRSRSVEKTSTRLGQGFVGKAALERRTVRIPDRASFEQLDDLFTFLSLEGFIAYYAAPLVAKGQIKGMLEVYHRDPLHPDPEWLNFFETLSSQAAIAIDNAELFENLQRANLELTLAYDTTLEGWVRALDLRDRETEGHTQRVAEATVRLAQSMGMNDEELIHVRRGVLLHDIGKMGVPDYILHKPGPLTDEEWEIMRQHPVYAHQFLSRVAYLRRAIDIPYCHHEKWDGSGYPQGLKGEQIPLTARIFAVVDVWDALSSDRPYREAWDKSQVSAYIRANSDSHFDPGVVEVFLKLFPE